MGIDYARPSEDELRMLSQTAELLRSNPAILSDGAVKDLFCYYSVHIHRLSGLTADEVKNNVLFMMGRLSYFLETYTASPEMALLTLQQMSSQASFHLAGLIELVELETTAEAILERSMQAREGKSVKH